MSTLQTSRDSIGGMKLPLTLGAVAAVLTSACSPYLGLARGQFVRDYSCPADQVVVGLAPKVAPVGASPPAEVAANPQRLAIWREEAQREATRQAEDQKRYVATGCGHVQAYHCYYGAESEPSYCTASR